MKNFLCLLVIMLCVLSCTDTSKVNPEISNFPIDFTVRRFDVALAKASPLDIAALKKEYPYFFSNTFNEDYWKIKISDTIQKEIEQEVSKAFSDIDKTSLELELLFKHIKYYYPGASVPKAIMVATDVDYRNKIILSDSLLFVSLSTYLGTDHYFYKGISRFHVKNFRQEQITVDVAHAFVETQVPPTRSSQFIAQVIYEGKKLYLMEQLLSNKPLHEILSYSSEELAFSQANEVNIWEYFIRKELLFSTDRKLLSRFVDPAPFSKFYLDLDNETPGRIGRYLGYKIVASYMNTNKEPIKTMLLKDAETIFNKARYKP